MRLLICALALLWISVAGAQTISQSVSTGGVAQGSTTAGQSGTLVQGAATTAAPTYTTGQTAPLSLTTNGALRIIPMGPGGVSCANALGGGATNCVLQVGGQFMTTPSTLTNTAVNTLMLTNVGSLRTSAGGNLGALNITTATNVKATTGRIYRIVLNAVGATATSIIDSTGTSVTAANTILTIPNTAVAGTVFVLDWPCATGISVVPGTNAVLAVSYE